MILNNATSQSVIRANQSAKPTPAVSTPEENPSLNPTDKLESSQHHSEPFFSKSFKANCAFTASPVAGAAVAGLGAYELASVFTSNPWVAGGAAAVAGAVGGSVGLMFGWAAAWGIMGD